MLSLEKNQSNIRNSLSITREGNFVEAITHVIPEGASYEPPRGNYRPTNELLDQLRKKRPKYEQVSSCIGRGLPNSANALATDSCYIGGDELTRRLRRARPRHETLYGP
ncbi:MAG TPA: hypothetical protein VFH48_15015, partial [Chloroflexota bacterium]|nr:hypothetical protein [Chloroflexota bacterium]